MPSSQHLLEELMEFIHFTPTHAAMMREMGPILRPRFDAIIERFYAAIDSNAGAAAVFTGGQPQRDRLKVQLRGWLEGLVRGIYDEVYYERRARIGRTHVSISLDQRYMLGAMNLIREELHTALDAAEEWPAERLYAAHRTIDKLCDMELAIMLETYREALIARAKDAERLATIGQIAASIGHELRNPLAVMQTSVHMLGRRLPSDDHTSKHLGRVRDQVALCNAIISDLLDLARDRPADRQPTDVGIVTRDAALSVPHTDALAVVSHVADGLPLVAVDPGQFRQLVVNLVLNAVQAQGGTGRVDVRLVVTADTLVLGIEDSGPGMTPAVLERLFEPLFTTRATGTGLGLALCRRIVEKHGGTIAANNRAEGGAAFVVRIPLLPPTPAPALLPDNREAI
jgi:two-component system, NtrC family, sensor histidine kinase HydH